MQSTLAKTVTFYFNSHWVRNSFCIFASSGNNYQRLTVFCKEEKGNRYYNDYTDNLKHLFLIKAVLYRLYTVL